MFHHPASPVCSGKMNLRLQGDEGIVNCIADGLSTSVCFGAAVLSRDYETKGLQARGSFRMSRRSLRLFTVSSLEGDAAGELHDAGTALVIDLSERAV